MTSPGASDDFGSMPEDELSRHWCAAGKEYAAAANAFLDKARRQKGIIHEPEPIDRRKPMARFVLDAVRRANVAGDWSRLRQRFPPAHGPFVEMLEENGTNLPTALLLEDGRILVQIGDAGVGIIDGDTLHRLNGIDFVARSPDGRYFAVARGAGIEVRDGWEGPPVTRLSWPTGQEGVPLEFQVPMQEGLPYPKALIPFPQGDRVLLVSSEGIFVVGQNGCRRLLKSTAEIREYLVSVDPFELAQRRPYDCFDLHMAHAAISPDGRWIVCGHQDSNHLLYDAATCEPVGTVLPRSSYPDFAAFSRDGSMVALNACHWYHGSTLGVPIAAFARPGCKLSTDDPEVITLEREARVCAASSRHDEFIVGDAYGMLRAFDLKGGFRWQHFVGSTIDAIDVSPDGARLIVTSCAGFLCILDLDSAEPDPYTIGTATHREVRRWLFWKHQPRPLIW